MTTAIELRSDTFTLPTPHMREAMVTAELGDEQYGEDPTVTRLEAMAAEMLGKEAGLFVNSGTMGNLLAALAHCQHGDEVILDAHSHQLNSETSNLAFVGGLLVKPIASHNGILDVGDVAAAIRPGKRTAPRTGMIAVENTHAEAGGIVVPLEHLQALSALAREHDVPLFMDGARIFNASVMLGVDVREITQYVDSVSFCLSKGLCCPAGTLIVGDASFIQRAARFKQMIGGYMRQTGVLAAAGIVALETMIDRLAEDHTNARTLAEGLARVDGLDIDLDAVQTNILFADIDQQLEVDATEFARRVAEQNVNVRVDGPRRIRMVTHHGVSTDDVQVALEIIHQVAATL